MSIIPFDLPRAEGIYPPSVVQERDRLLRDFQEEAKNPSLRRKLELLIRAFNLFAVQVTIEDTVRINALTTVRAVREQNRALQEAAKIERLTNG